METLQKLKCALTTKSSLKKFYSTLPEDQLKERRAYSFKLFLSLCSVWILSWFLIVWGTKMDMPLIILFSGAIMGTVISLWVDYRNKIKLINQILKSRELL